jgi:hypothetical protein
MRGYIISLDPAQLRDWSALSAIEISREPGEQYNRYKLVSLERRQRQPYDLIAGWAKVAYQNPAFRDGTSFLPIFVMDGTNERTLKDLLRRAGVPARGIVYTSGEGWSREGRDYHASKVLMVKTFLALWDSKRFTMPSKASFAGIFSSELRAFRGEISKMGKLRFEAAEGEHDDLIFSVCQACWFAEELVKPKRSFCAQKHAVAFGNPLVDEANESLGPMAGQEEEPASWLWAGPGYIRMTR